MADTENPLSQLPPEKQKQLVELVEDTDIETLAAETGLGKDEILKIGMAITGGGVLGGAAATQFVQQTRAQADTGDADGNVGLPSSRVDVFADGADVNSVNSGGPVSDGDGTERKVWVIANGASDPAGASNDDLILEEMP